MARRTAIRRPTPAPRPARRRPARSSSRPSASLLETTDRLAFGARFFLEHLAGFVTARCPKGSTRLPHVQLHLIDGEVLDLGHVLGVSRRWVAVAVNGDHNPEPRQRVHIELVPYVSIRRVTVRVSPGESPIGFDTAHAPEVLALGSDLTPEAVLAILAGKPHGRRGARPTPARSRRGDVQGGSGDDDGQPRRASERLDGS